MDSADSFATPTDPALVQLLTTLQWSDSAFPSGLYTLSHGLEPLSQAGIATAHNLFDVARNILIHSVGPTDTTATLLAWHAAADGDIATVIDIDHTVSATRVNDAMRRSSQRVGTQLLTMVAEIHPEIATTGVLNTYRTHRNAQRTPGNQAVACALIQHSLGVSADICAAAELAAWVNGIAGAAIRLRLADHISAQRLIRDLAPVITEVLADSRCRSIADLGAATPVLDLHSARHERAPARLFMN